MKKHRTEENSGEEKREQVDPLLLHWLACTGNLTIRRDENGVPFFDEAEVKAIEKRLVRLGRIEPSA